MKEIQVPLNEILEVGNPYRGGYKVTSYCRCDGMFTLNEDKINLRRFTWWTAEACPICDGHPYWFRTRKSEIKHLESLLEQEEANKCL